MGLKQIKLYGLHVSYLSSTAFPLHITHTTFKIKARYATTGTYQPLDRH